MQARVPTTIFSGFLGSGKTTVISHLIEVLQKEGTQVVYIKNEIGDTDIDGQLLQSQNIKTRQLLNGCICCTLVGPFTAALTEVVDQYHPDRIFIEASGAADPSALALMVSAHPLLHRDGVIGLVDVTTFTGYADLTETTRNQTKFIDIIVFNKIELADMSKKRRVVNYIREINTHSPIIEAPSGKIAPSLVLGLYSNELNTLLQTRKYEESEESHINHDHIESITLRTNGITTEIQLRNFITALPKQLIRCKGIVQLNQTNWVVCNSVGERIDIYPVPEHMHPTESIFVCIGISIHQFEDMVNTEFSKIFSSDG